MKCKCGCVPVYIIGDDVMCYRCIAEVLKDASNFKSGLTITKLVHKDPILDDLMGVING